MLIFGLLLKKFAGYASFAILCLSITTPIAKYDIPILFNSPKKKFKIYKYECNV